MSKYWELKIPLLLLLLLCSNKAYGYIDPGTVSPIFGIIAPLLSMLLVFLAFLIRPFRRFFRSVIDKFSRGVIARNLPRGSPKSETNEQLTSEGVSNHQGDGEDK